MKRVTGLASFTCVCYCLLSAVLAHGQTPNTYLITPDRTTMAVGETRTFRMVDQTGRAQHKVSWTFSDADAMESVEGDQIRIRAKRAGDYRLVAHTDYAFAEATVKVVEPGEMAAGTVKWRSGGISGCQTVKVIPAVRSAYNGPDFFEQSVCEDGEYVAAYTLEGVQLWRRKISGNTGGGRPMFGTGDGGYETFGNPLETTKDSICDVVKLGAEQDAIREMVAARKLAFNEDHAAKRVWTVEENNAQCRLTFDERNVLVKKRKVFTTQ